MRRELPWIALSLLASIPASAQTRCAETDRVEALVRQAQAHRDADRPAEALQVLEEAYALCHRPSELARRAFAHQAMGQWLRADELIRGALAATDDPWIRRTRRDLTRAAALIAQHIGEVELQGTGPSAEVFVDNQRMGNWPGTRSFRVPSGGVVLSVRASGHHPWERRIAVEGGAVARETVSLVPLPPPPEPPPPPLVVAVPQTPARGAPQAPVAARTPVEPVAPPSPPPSAMRGGDRTLRALAWTGAGLALVGIGIGVAGVVIRGDRWNDYARSCNWNGTGMENPGTAAQCASLYDDYRASSLQGMQWGGFVAGGVLAVTSAVLFGVSGGRSADRASVSCGIGPGTAGMSCGGVF